MRESRISGLQETMKTIDFLVIRHILCNHPSICVTGLCCTAHSNCGNLNAMPDALTQKKEMWGWQIKYGNSIAAALQLFVATVMIRA